MFFLNFICLTFLIVFFFLSLLLTYFCQFSFKRFFVHLRRSFRVSRIVSKQFRNQNDLLSLLDFVHDTVLSIISIKYFCSFFMFSSICSFVFDFLIDEAHFFISFTFFAFIDFQSFRNTIDVVTMFSSIFVNIEMWSNDWLIFDLALQCSILLIISLNMKIKSIVLCEFLTFQVIVSWENVNFMSASSITSIKLFVIACCVNFESSFHRKWCRLKSLNTMCFVSTSFIYFFIINIVLTLFVDE